MPALGATAHYRAKGDRNAHVAMEDPLENRGFALWLSCQGKIRTSKAKKVTGPADRGVGDVSGYEVEVNLKRKCFDLWPGLNQMDRISQDAFSSEIYAYLRASGNAVCVRQPGVGQHGIPLWWIRETWNDVKAVGIFKQTELTAREKRLTPQEAGEDRTPAPVTVRQREEAAEAMAAASKGPRDHAADIMAVIKASAQPLYQREISEALDLAPLTTGRVLRELEEEGTLYRRLEGRGERPENASGRYRYLYWHQAKIPLRHTPLDVTNRTLERINALKPGESLATRWMTPGPRQEVQELVDAGVLEYFERPGPDGELEQRIRLAPSPAHKPAEPTPPAPPEVKPPEPTPALTGVVSPPAQTYTGMEAIGKAISELVEIEVQKRIRDAESTISQLREELAREFERAESAEARLEGIRKQLGF